MQTNAPVRVPASSKGAASGKALSTGKPPVKNMLPLVVVGTLAATGTAAGHVLEQPQGPAETQDVKQSPAPSASESEQSSAADTLAPATPGVRPSGVEAETQSAVAAAASGVIHQYIVSAGDTVSTIAERLGMSTGDILQANGLDWDSVIYPDQALTLPGGSAGGPSGGAAAVAGATSHTVQAGDTISQIADRYGMSTGRLLSLNGLGAKSIIFPGQVLQLADSGAAASTVEDLAPGDHAELEEYVLRAGDTMTEVANRAGVSLAALLSANSLSMTSIIYAGQTIVIPRADAPVRNPEVQLPMTGEARANALTIIRVGRDAGVSDDGIVVALATAMQESALRNLDYGDRDSLGVFQQRPSFGWGTELEVRDVERASRAFFGGAVNPNPGVTRGLLDIAGWESMSVTEAAQAVQLSGHPNHYAKWESTARDWLAALG